MEEKRKCSRCNTEKEFPKEFHFKKERDYHYPYCRECQREYTRDHYKNNKQYYKDKAKRHRDEYQRENYIWLYQYFKANPCVDCGETNPIKLEFDHERDKTANVSELLNRASLERVKKEVAKCSVRCRNCHIMKTAERGNWYWLEILKEFGPIGNG